jgi:isopentenyldiphosphate isomerase
MEMIEVYSLGGKFLKKMERGAYHSKAVEEFRKKGKISTKIKRVVIILLTSDGRVHVQQRTMKSDAVNAGLYDKTVGGHVVFGISDDETALKETREELGINSIVSQNRRDFKNKLCQANLKENAVIMAVSHEPNFMSVRKKRDITFIQPYINTSYIGYYDGGVKFLDGEVSKVEKVYPEELGRKIKARHDMYTEDLKFMLKKFRKYLIPVKDFLSS